MAARSMSTAMPALVITGPAVIASGGNLNVQSGSVTFANGSLLNDGTITVHHNGSLLIEENSINAGTIHAVGTGATVTIENATITNSITDAHGNIVDGRIDVGAGAHLVLNNGAILQGIVQVDAGGEIDTVSGTANTINTANGPSHNTTVPSIINDGVVDIVDNSSLTLVNPHNIENRGTVELGSTGDKTFLYFNQPFAILSGGGGIVLEGGEGSQDIIAAIPGQIGQGFLTVSAGESGQHHFGRRRHRPRRRSAGVQKRRWRHGRSQYQRRDAGHRHRHDGLPAA